VESQRMVALTVALRIATIVLRREKQLNALNETLLRQLDGVLDELATRTDVRVVLIRGEGKAFAAGADIAAMQPLTAIEAERFATAGQGVLNKLEHLSQPTIALVHGFALGGGMELAMACDVRIAAAGAKFGQPEVTLGVTPGFGGSQRLPRIVGQGRAMWLLLSGQWIDAEEAYRIGLVTEVVPEDALQQRGQELGEQLAALAPHALRMVKQAVYAGAEVDQDKGLAMEASLFGLCFATTDQKAGMAAFLDKRKADFEGK